MLHKEDDLVVCPYNMAHLIRPKRMMTHLSKCRKHNLLEDFDICPLDTTHHIPKKEMAIHLEICPSRFVVDTEMYKRSDDGPTIPLPSPDFIKSLLGDSDEDWTNDDAPTYDPYAHTNNKRVIRIKKGVPPAERKAWQQQERRRLEELREMEIRNGPVAQLSTSHQASGSQPQRSTGLEGARLPMKPSKALAIVLEHRKKEAQSPEKMKK